ncbi:MAG: hypothetical protein AAF471_08315, partial [Myxococcota bacterium]
DLMAFDSSTRELLGTRMWHVNLQGTQNQFACISFNGDVVKTQLAPSQGALNLRFLSDRHLVDVFSATKASKLPPMPTGGWRQVRAIPAFSRLSRRLSQVMVPHAEYEVVRTKILFNGLLTRALALLGNHQPSAGRMMSRYGEFYFSFVLAADVQSWLGFDGRQFVAGQGHCPQPTTLTIEFSDLETAGLAASGKLDQLAAIGSGRLRVTGLTPLGDTLDILLDRIDQYLR